MINGKTKLSPRSKKDPATNTVRDFFLILVPVSQCGNASAAMCEIRARGIAIKGFEIWAASASPMNACPVAVIF